MSVETSFSFSTSISVAINFSFVSLVITSDVEDAALLAVVDDEAEVEAVVDEEELDGEVVTILYNTGEQRTAVEGSSRPAREMAGTLS